MPCVQSMFSKWLKVIKKCLILPKTSSISSNFSQIVNGRWRRFAAKGFFWQQVSEKQHVQHLTVKNSFSSDKKNSELPKCTIYTLFKKDITICKSFCNGKDQASISCQYIRKMIKLIARRGTSESFHVNVNKYNKRFQLLKCRLFWNFQCPLSACWGFMNIKAAFYIERFITACTIFTFYSQSSVSWLNTLLCWVYNDSFDNLMYSEDLSCSRVLGIFKIILYKQYSVRRYIISVCVSTGRSLSLHFYRSTLNPHTTSVHLGVKL